MIDRVFPGAIAGWIRQKEIKDKEELAKALEKFPKDRTAGKA